MFGNRKKPQETLNEITVTVMSKTHKTNYHETFLMDTTKYHNFEFNGKTYNIPAEDTGHYPPSFWSFDIKLGMFFEQHKTLGTLFDWFGFRKRACYEIGYLYWEDNSDPEKVKHEEYDWALENFNLQRNTTIEGACKDTDLRLKGKKDNTNWLLVIGAIIIGVVACVVVLTVLTGNTHPAQQVVQNVTASTATNSTALGP